MPAPSDVFPRLGTARPRRSRPSNLQTILPVRCGRSGVHPRGLSMAAKAPRSRSGWSERAFLKVAIPGSGTTRQLGQAERRRTPLRCQFAHPVRG